MSERSVDENDYNQLRTKVSNILGNGFSDRGYGQTLVSSEAQEGSVITTAQWKELTEDLSNAIIHQTGSAPSVPDFENDNTIDLFDLNQIETLVNTLDSNRFSIGNGRFAINIKGSQSISVPWSERAQTILTVTFESSDKARYFFNSGGKIRFSTSRSGGTNSPQNSAWTNILNSVETLDFKAYDSNLIGFYNLNDQYKTFYQKNLSTPYSSNYFRIETISNVGDNSTGSANQITFRIIWEDAFTGIQDTVDGKLQIDVSQILPVGPLVNENSFVISEPEYRLENITLVGQPNKVYILESNKLSASAVNDSFVITLNTVNVPDGEAVPYSITGVNSNEIGDNPLVSSFVVFNNQATKTFVTTSSDYIGVPSYIPQPVPNPIPVPQPNPIPVPVDLCQEFVVFRQDVNDRSNWANLLDLSNSASWTIGLPNHQSVARYTNYSGMLDPKTSDSHPVAVFGINASLSTVPATTDFQRSITTKNLVNVSDISQFVFKINKGTVGGWGQVPEKNSGTTDDEALELQYSSDGKTWTTLERYVPSQISNDTWIEKSVNVPTVTATTISREFPYAEGVQNFVVPAGVNSLNVTMYSGAGGSGGANTIAGQSGQGRQKLTFTLPVNPSDIISVYTGGGGEGGYTEVAGVRNTSDVQRVNGSRFLTAQGGKSYPGYEGGQGGRPGSFGRSGAGGGGGGATVLLKNNVITAVVGGGGGGAGGGASTQLDSGLIARWYQNLVLSSVASIGSWNNSAPNALSGTTLSIGTAQRTALKANMPGVGKPSVYFATASAQNQVTVITNSQLNLSGLDSSGQPKDFTIEAWVYATGTGTNPSGYGGIIVNKDFEYEVARFGNGRIGIAVDWAQGSAASLPGSGWIFTDYFLPLNEAHLISVVFQGYDCLLYVDGNLEWSASIDGFSSRFTVYRNTPLATNRALWIGGRPGASQQFEGYITDVRLWNVARTQTQIRSSIDEIVTGAIGNTKTHDPETTYRTSTQSTKGGDGFDRGNLAGTDGGGSGGGGGGARGGLGGANGGTGDVGGYRGSRGSNLIPSNGQVTQDSGGSGGATTTSMIKGSNGTDGSMTISYQSPGSSQSMYLRYYQKGNNGAFKKVDTWAMTTIKGKPKTTLPVRTVFKICPRSVSINEGSSLIFDVTAQGLGNGRLYATLNSSTVTAADFTTGTTSYIVDIVNDKGTFTLSFKEDKITEGDALFFMELREGSTTGTVVARSPSITLYDTSTVPAPVPTQAISANFTTEYNSTTNYTEFKLTVTGPGYGIYRYTLNATPSQNWDTFGTFDNPSGGNLVWSVISGSNTRATFRVKAPHRSFAVTATVTRDGYTTFTKTLQIPERIIPKQKKQQIWTSGSGSWLVPNGVTSVEVTAVGGGAGGASGSEADPYVSGGGGGSSGGLIRKTISVTPGQRLSYSVGAGGAGASATTGGSVKNGAAGGKTTFGSVVAAGGNPPNSGYSKHYNLRGLAPTGGIPGTDAQVVKSSSSKLKAVTTSGGRGGGIPDFGTGGAEGTVSRNNGQNGSGYGAGGGGGFGQSGGAPPQGGGGSGTGGYLKIEWEE